MSKKSQNFNFFLNIPNRIIRMIIGILPPYPIIEGQLSAKERGSEGAYHILIDTNDIIEVDSFTWSTLIVGEPIRIRCTRENRAIYIVRLDH
tara:strand:- start:112 stop:387 length:276 start_codon:yes stop_codon:yes gene_type:complete